MEKKTLVTAALPYVNNVPHLGNIIGCVLSADVYARFLRSLGKEVLYICGTDEYGTTTEYKADEEGVSPQEICQKYYQLHLETYQWFDISFDIFGRTSTEQQTQITHQIFKQLWRNGFVFEDQIEQLYCTDCQKFLADRYLIGMCPHCQSSDARGDQCDNCGKLINTIELINPKCKKNNMHQIETKKSWHLFLDLSRLQPEIEKFYQSVGHTWSPNAQQITESWLKIGLKPRCITRDLKWGTPVPPVEGLDWEKYCNKVFYVWFDAPIGYLSITANLTSNWEEWWTNSRLVQFMAKDNVPFHSLIFPATLIGTVGNHTLVDTISSTEYLMYQNKKFSKSRGIGIFGDQVQKTGIGPDYWRYYLLSIRPESADSNFDWKDFQNKINGELCNNFGNICFRVLNFIYSGWNKAPDFRPGFIPQFHDLTDEDINYLNKFNQKMDTYFRLMEAIKLRDGLKEIMEISRLTNEYYETNKPHILLMDTSTIDRGETVFYILANMIKTLVFLAEPFIPSIKTKIQYALNLNEIRCTIEIKLDLEPGHPLNKPEKFFSKISNNQIKELEKMFDNKNYH